MGTLMVELNPAASEAATAAIDQSELRAQICALRAENTRLREENATLMLWKGDAELPVSGGYYFADDELLQANGWCFGDGDRTPLRFERTQLRKSIRRDGSAYNSAIEYIFTAPFKYDEDDICGRSGWVTIQVTTPDLHRMSPVDWNLNTPYPLRYLKSDDTVQTITYLAQGPE